MQNKYGDQGFTVVALSPEGESVVQKFAKEQKLTYPIGIDPSGKTVHEYGITSIPHAFLVSADGRVVWEGHPGGGEYESLLKEELAQTSTLVPAKPLGKGLEKLAEKLKSGEFAEAIKLAKAAENSDDAKGVLDQLTAK